MAPVAVDLFAGAGGLSLGAEMAGVNIVYANDIFAEAVETYRFNNPDTPVHQGPIEEVKPADILATANLQVGELDILLGGPPCQGFSINAPIRTMEDQRNALVLEYLRIVEGLRPKYLVIENVPGLLSLDGGTALETVYERLEALGYHAAHRVLLASRYGVPQERWRLIILGQRNDMPPVDFPAPTHNATAKANFTGGSLWASVEDHDMSGLPPAVTVAEAIGDLPPLQNGEGHPVIPMPEVSYEKLTFFQRWARSGADFIYNHQAQRLGAINLKRLQHIKPGGNWTDIPVDLLPAGMRRARRSDHTKRYGRMNPQGQSCTILTKCDPHWGSFFHYNQDRAVTPREAARLQSFPDRYVFQGSLSAQYEQIGNAVPPLLGQAIVSEVVASWTQAQPHLIEERA